MATNKIRQGTFEPTGTVAFVEVDSNNMLSVTGTNSNVSSYSLNNFIDMHFKDNKDVLVNSLSDLSNGSLLTKVTNDVTSQVRSGAITKNDSKLDLQVQQSIAEWIDTERDDSLRDLNDKNKALGLPQIGQQSVLLKNKQYNPSSKKDSLGQKIMENELDSRLSLPTLYNGRTIGSNDSLQEVITGSDLSVFYIAEVYKIEDVLTSPQAPWIWRKDLVMMELDTVMSISYSTVREVFPVRTLGISKPKGFTRGPMTISGHITFSVFTEDVLDRLRTQMLTSIEKARDKSRSAIEKNDKIIQQGLSNKESSLSSSIDTFLSNQSVLENIIKELGDSIEVTKKELDEASKNLTSTKERKSFLETSITDLRNKIAELDLYILMTPIPAEKERLNSEKQLLINEMDTLLENLKETTAQLEIDQKKYDELNTKMQDLLEQTDSATANLDEIRNMYSEEALSKGADLNLGYDAKDSITAERLLFQQNLLYEKILRDNSVYLLNQLGPFHLLIMGTNERGTFSKMMIKNIRVIDENQMQGVQQPNIVNRVTFGAEDIVPMTSINADSNTDATSRNDMGKWGSSNLALFSGSDIMRDIEFMTMQDSSIFINNRRNY